jgi:hypothetical protein
MCGALHGQANWSVARLSSAGERRWVGPRRSARAARGVGLEPVEGRGGGLGASGAGPPGELGLELREPSVRVPAERRGLRGELDVRWRGRPREQRDRESRRHRKERTGRGTAAAELTGSRTPRGSARAGPGRRPSWGSTPRPAVAPTATSSPRHSASTLRLNSPCSIVSRHSSMAPAGSSSARSAAPGLQKQPPRSAMPSALAATLDLDRRGPHGRPGRGG